jgi:DNA-binding transcriptional LysR family regulator
VDIRQLRCFVAVAEELHFGRAAARLHVAGPAVSQTIRSIENELALTLFHRTNRRVVLTDPGHRLLVEARAVLERYEAALAAMERVRVGESGQVRVGAVAALPPRLVPELLTRCVSEAPGIDVVVTALGSSYRLNDALERDTDIALVRGQLDEPTIESLVVAREPVGIAVPSDHWLATQRAISPEHLNGVPLISFPPAIDPAEHERLFGALGAAGLDKPRLVHESHPGAVEGSLRLVASGAGLSLKLQSEVRAFGNEQVKWRPLADVKLDVIISAAWRPARSTPAIQRVLALLAPSEEAH